MEDFQPSKILHTLRNVGVSPAVGRKVLEELQLTLYDGITTKEIQRRVRDLMSKSEMRAAMRYDLKAAMMQLGPAGFPFENFVAEVLENYGYETKVRSFVRGECVRHEVDVIATAPSGHSCMIECKFHNQPGLYVDLKDVLYTYARFLDLRGGTESKGGLPFDEVWLVSNTRASSEAMTYAKCKGLRLVCWNYPRGKGLEKMIGAKDLFPVTVLPSVDKDTLDKLFAAGLMLAKDILDKDVSYLSGIGLSSERLTRLMSEARQFAQRS